MTGQGDDLAALVKQAACDVLAGITECAGYGDFS
jgi:hypothetical protein